MTFVTELRKVADHCDCSAVLSDMLRYWLVCGTNKRIQGRLLLEPGLTLGKALEIDLVVEAAEKALGTLAVPL